MKDEGKSSAGVSPAVKGASAPVQVKSLFAIAVIGLFLIGKQKAAPTS